MDLLLLQKCWFGGEKKETKTNSYQKYHRSLFDLSWSANLVLTWWRKKSKSLRHCSCRMCFFEWQNWLQEVSVPLFPWLCAMICCVRVSPEAAAERQSCEAAHGNQESRSLLLVLVLRGLLVSQGGSPRAFVVGRVRCQAESRSALHDPKSASSCGEAKAAAPSR